MAVYRRSALLEPAVTNQLRPSRKSLKALLPDVEAKRAQNVLRASLREGKPMSEFDFSWLEQCDILDLTDTNLKGIPSGVERLTGLMTLVLSKNGLTTLPAKSFAPLVALQRLELRLNKISSICTGAFDGLEGVLHLDLESNSLEELHEDMFAGLPAVRTLILGRNQIDIVHKYALRGLTSLRSLDISQNELGEIHPQAFESVPELATLSLEKNAIRFLPGGLFRTSLALSSLDLAASCFGEGSISLEIFVGATSLQRLDLKHSRLRSLPPQLFKPLRVLSTLDLSQNELQRLTPDATAGLVQLQWLSLSHNILKVVDAGTFQNSKGLTFLDLSHNLLTEFSGKLVTGLETLATLNLDSNFITVFPSLPKSVRAMRQLKLSHNCAGKIPYDSFEQCRSLNDLDLSYNYISRYVGKEPFYGMNKLKTLDLSHNRLPTLPSGCFKALTQLRNVDLSYNSVEEQPIFEMGKTGNIPKVDTRGNRCVGLLDTFGRPTTRDFEAGVILRRGTSAGTLLPGVTSVEEPESPDKTLQPSEVKAKPKPKGSAVGTRFKSSSVELKAEDVSHLSTASDLSDVPRRKDRRAKTMSEATLKGKAGLPPAARSKKRAMTQKVLRRPSLLFEEDQPDEAHRRKSVGLNRRVSVFEQPMTVLVGPQLEF